eukprot:27620_1
MSFTEKTHQTKKRRRDNDEEKTAADNKTDLCTETVQSLADQIQKQNPKIATQQIDLKEHQSVVVIIDYDDTIYPTSLHHEKKTIEQQTINNISETIQTFISKIKRTFTFFSIIGVTNALDQWISSCNMDLPFPVVSARRFERHIPKGAVLWKRFTIQALVNAQFDGTLILMGDTFTDLECINTKDYPNARMIKIKTMKHHHKAHPVTPSVIIRQLLWVSNNIKDIVQIGEKMIFLMEQIQKHEEKQLRDSDIWATLHSAVTHVGNKGSNDYNKALMLTKKNAIIKINAQLMQITKRVEICDRNGLQKFRGVVTVKNMDHLGRTHGAEYEINLFQLKRTVYVLLSIWFRVKEWTDQMNMCLICGTCLASIALRNKHMKSVHGKYIKSNESTTEGSLCAVIAEDIDIALLESTVSQHNVDMANVNTSNQIIISGLKTNIDAEVAAFNTDNDVNYLATGGAYRLSDIAFQMEPDIAFHYDFDDDCDELTETHLDIPCLDFDCDELHIPCLDFDLDGAPEMVTHDDCDELNETHLHIRIIWTLIAVACCIITFINDYCVHDGVGYDMHTLIDTEIDHECGLLYQNQELIANEFTDYCELRTALSWDMSREILQEAMHCARGGDVHGDTLWQGDACGYTLWQEFTCFASFESYVQQPILRGEHEDEDLHSFRDDLQPVNGSSWFGDGDLVLSFSWVFLSHDIAFDLLSCLHDFGRNGLMLEECFETSSWDVRYGETWCDYVHNGLIHPDCILQAIDPLLKSQLIQLFDAFYCDTIDWNTINELNDTVRDIQALIFAQTVDFEEIVRCSYAPYYLLDACKDAWSVCIPFHRIAFGMLKALYDSHLNFDEPAKERFCPKFIGKTLFRRKPRADILPNPNHRHLDDNRNLWSKLFLVSTTNKDVYILCNYDVVRSYRMYENTQSSNESSIIASICAISKYSASVESFLNGIKWTFVIDLYSQGLLFIANLYSPHRDFVINFANVTNDVNDIANYVYTETSASLTPRKGRADATCKWVTTI